MHQFWFSSSIFVPFRISPQPIRRQARLMRREMATFSPIFVHTDCDNEIRALLNVVVSFMLQEPLLKKNSLRISLAHNHTRATRKRTNIEHKIFMLFKWLDFRIFTEVSNMFQRIVQSITKNWDTFFYQELWHFTRNNLHFQYINIGIFDEDRGQKKCPNFW